MNLFDTEPFRKRVAQLEREIEQRRLELARITLQMETHTAQEVAIANGHRYFKGKPCAQGHTLRYAKNARCAICAAEHTRSKRSKA